VKSRPGHAIPEPSNGHDQLGIRRVTFDLGAQPPHVRVDQAAVAQIVVAPDAVEQLAAWDGPARVAAEIQEQVELHPAQLDLPAAPPLQGDAERLRLFESVVSFLHNAAASHPLVLILDDLHWADKPSLLMLRYLTRNLAGERLLLVGTYRDVELDRKHPLAEVLADYLQQRALVQRMR